MPDARKIRSRTDTVLSVYTADLVYNSLRTVDCICTFTKFYLQMISNGVQSRGATTFSKLGVQFLGLGYCTEQNTDGIPSFVHCYVKSWGGPSNLGGSGPLRLPVVAPLVDVRWATSVQ